MNQRPPAGDGAARGKAPTVTPQVAAEAAVWVARLHGPARSPRMERECLAWQAQSAAHREAFERCTQTWQDVAGVSLASAYAAGAQAHARQGPHWPRRALAVGLAGLLVAAGVLLWRGAGADDYRTVVGEQRQVQLADGTRLALNTDTDLRVALGDTQRTVTVARGEALFEVAPDARRPFVVRAAGREVVALGTVFTVRVGDAAAPAGSAVAVTLLEGQVALRPAAGGGGDAAAPPLLLHPGERARFGAGAGQGAAARVDRPRLDQVVAWRRAEAVFDATPLADAVAEMNRYSRTPIVLVDAPALAALRVSGLYRTGDNAAFAQAVAALHGLQLRTAEGRLELALPP